MLCLMLSFHRLPGAGAFCDNAGDGWNADNRLYEKAEESLLSKITYSTLNVLRTFSSCFCLTIS